MQAPLRQPASRSGGELYLFINPAIRVIDWSSPKAGILSFVKGGVIHSLGDPFSEDFVKSTIGHAIVRFECTDQSGRTHDVWTGMTGQNDTTETRADLIKRGMGLSTLFKGYVDGELYGNEKTRHQVVDFHGRIERNVRGQQALLKPQFMKWEIDSKQCSDLVDYVETYRKQGYDHSQSLDVLRKKDPRDVLLYGLVYDSYELFKTRKAKGKGQLAGGCTSFAVGALKAADVFDERFDDFWKMKIDVSERLMGGLPDEQGKPRFVAFDKLLGSLGASWTHAGYRNRALEFYDTERMWQFIEGVRNCADFDSGRLKERPARCTDELLSLVKSRKGRLNVYERMTLKDTVTRMRPVQLGGGKSQPVYERREEEVEVVREGVHWRD